MAAVYGFCLKTAQRLCEAQFAEQGYAAEDVRSVATTLLIAAQRKFGL